MAYSRVEPVQRRKSEAEAGREHGVAMGWPAMAGRFSQTVVPPHPRSAGVLAKGERLARHFLPPSWLGNHCVTQRCYLLIIAISMIRFWFFLFFVCVCGCCLGCGVVNSKEEGMGTSALAGTLAEDWGPTRASIFATHFTLFKQIFGWLDCLFDLAHVTMPLPTSPNAQTIFRR